MAPDGAAPGRPARAADSGNDIDAAPDLGAARAVKEEVQARLAGDERLRGVGLAAREDEPGSYAVVVRVVTVTSAAELGVPEVVRGVPIWVIVAGEVTARSTASAAEDEAGG